MEWYIPSFDEADVEYLVKKLKIPHLLAKVLINRGLTEPEIVYRFLYPRLSYLHDPWKFKDMKKAVYRIYKAIINQEKVLIYGDYDTDGITSTSILYLFLFPLISKLFYYLPHRLKEGYGLNIQAIKRFAEMGISLLITTDCGISNKEEIVFANQLGLDVIIIDHHEVPKILPPAYAIINPKQPDCSFPFKELAGVGVTFNLLIALRQFLYRQGIWNESEIPNLKVYLDLVALGTIADMVPLIDENRIFVKCGLEVLSTTQRPGLKALKAISGLNDRIT
ncbi:MAG TPA: single-stranded-DNA-specific exonuclease RecJ, partial [Candidatus Desulfofervidus auxilii]|nr:single-stranded-DNA-specific exonuclease RecJ [Candidatus Desulfofervidus auxilii]